MTRSYIPAILLWRTMSSGSGVRANRWTQAMNSPAVFDEHSVELTLVIPCLNEERYIAETLDTVIAAMSQLPYTYEALVIDDGCTDRTAEIVEQYRDAHPGVTIRLHRNKKNCGLTRSYVDGAFLGRGK